MQLSKYNKFWVALGAVCAVAGVALSDGVVTPAEGLQIAVAFLGALGVRQVTNTQ